MGKTIQIGDRLAEKLDSLKDHNKSYEDTILKLIEFASRENKQEFDKEQEELLIEGYKDMAEESLKICNEFKYADSELDRNKLS